MRSIWPQVADPDDAAAAALDGPVEHVVSSTPQDRLEEKTVLDSEPLAAVRKPKEQPDREAQVHGRAGWAPPSPRTPRSKGRWR